MNTQAPYPYENILQIILRTNLTHCGSMNSTCVLKKSMRAHLPR